MKLGCCISILSFMPKPDQGEEWESNKVEQLLKSINIIRRNGYDYAEMTVGSIMNLKENEFVLLKNKLLEQSIEIPAFNSFIPASIPLTGFNVSIDTIDEYVAIAMERIAQLGGKYVVFGSGSARCMPHGFSYEQARDQIIRFLSICNNYGQNHGIKVAIEPLNKKETNIINKVEEAVNLVSYINFPNIGVLADTYHMYLENEDWSILQHAAPWLMHVHISENDRTYPRNIGVEGVNYEKFFTILQKIGYKGGVSVECQFQHLENESRESLKYLKRFLI